MGDDIVVLSYGQRGTLTNQLMMAAGKPKLWIKMTLEERMDSLFSLQEASVKKTSQSSNVLLVVVRKRDWTSEDWYEEAKERVGRLY